MNNQQRNNAREIFEDAMSARIRVQYVSLTGAAKAPPPAASPRSRSPRRNVLSPRSLRLVRAEPQARRPKSVAMPPSRRQPRALQQRQPRAHFCACRFAQRRGRRHPQRRRRRTQERRRCRRRRTMTAHRGLVSFVSTSCPPSRCVPRCWQRRSSARRWPRRVAAERGD